MPDVLVEIQKGWIEGRECEFLDSIQAALIEALHVPEDDKVLRLVAHAPGCFAVPRASRRFTHIEITMFEGRTLETKRALYQAITRSLEAYGVPPTDIKIILHEVNKANVGMRGGQAACDIDIGYEVAI
jgi:phenylpyruvate tautomerase PptA (4-oxalocrotonate tautomerase family)